ncbi:MAG: dUTP diphosphatase [Cetobacterium sp.]
MIDFSLMLQKQILFNNKMSLLSDTEEDFTNIKISAIAEVIEFQETLKETHKFWVENKYTRKDSLEEFIDILFFVIQLETQYMNINQEEELENYNKIMNKEFYSNRIKSVKINDDIEELMIRILRNDSWGIIETLGVIAEWMGFDADEINEAHRIKYSKNLKRIGTEWKKKGMK